MFESERREFEKTSSFIECRVNPGMRLSGYAAHFLCVGSLLAIGSLLFDSLGFEMLYFLHHIFIFILNRAQAKRVVQTQLQ
jgi:hypothetical protein